MRASMLLVALSILGCTKSYYRTMEAFGKEKRDILASRVEGARDAQEDTKEQFQSTLERFSALVGFEGGELEDVYRQLDSSYQRSEQRAEEVRDRVNAVENVAEDLFEEWEKELGLYESQDLRRRSEEQLVRTRGRYRDLIQAMRRAEGKMDPVLRAFRDQVLFLKHNLNARAIASLEGTVDSLESEVAALIREMDASIREANEFVQSIEAG